MKSTMTSQEQVGALRPIQTESNKQLREPCSGDESNKRKWIGYGVGCPRRGEVSEGECDRSPKREEGADCGTESDKRGRKEIGNGEGEDEAVMTEKGVVLLERRCEGEASAGEGRGVAEDEAEAKVKEKGSLTLVACGAGLCRGRCIARA